MTKKKPPKRMNSPPSAGQLERYRKFVEAFCGVAAGDQAESARLAGYEGKDTASLSETGRKLLRRKDVQEMIAAKAAADPLVMQGDDLRRLWSTIARGDVVVEVRNGRKIKNTPPIKERVRASEMLAKALGMFIKKVEVEHTGRVAFVAELPPNGRDDGT